MLKVTIDWKGHGRKKADNYIFDTLEYEYNDICINWLMCQRDRLPTENVKLSFVRQLGLEITYLH